MRGTAHDKADVALGAILRDVDQTLVQKSIVAQVGMGKVADARKVHDHRQTESVAELHGLVQGLVVHATLRTLHPVHDALALGVGCAPAPYGNTAVTRQGAHGLRNSLILIQLFRQLRVSLVFALRFVQFSGCGFLCAHVGLDGCPRAFVLATYYNFTPVTIMGTGAYPVPMQVSFRVVERSGGLPVTAAAPAMETAPTEAAAAKGAMPSAEPAAGAPGGEATAGVAAARSA